MTRSLHFTIITSSRSLQNPVVYGPCIRSSIDVDGDLCCLSSSKMTLQLLCFTQTSCWHDISLLPFSNLHRPFLLLPSWSPQQSVISATPSSRSLSETSASHVPTGLLPLSRMLDDFLKTAWTLLPELAISQPSRQRSTLTSLRSVRTSTCQLSQHEELPRPSSGIMSNLQLLGKHFGDGESLVHVLDAGNS
jgi:hypothetical protein